MPRFNRNEKENVIENLKSDVRGFSNFRQLRRMNLLTKTNFECVTLNSEILVR